MSSKKPNCSWCDLPELVLLSIAGRLLSLPSLAAFASVCRRWRLFLRSFAVNSHYPPLFLHPSPSHPFLTSFTLPSLHFTPHLPPPSLITDRHLAASHGRLISVDSTSNTLLLADVFTGSHTHSPPLPETRFPYYYATLTAAPSSLLLLFHSPTSFLYCRLGTHHWSTALLEPPVHVARVVSTAANRIFAVNDAADKIVEFCFDPTQEETMSVMVYGVNGINGSKMQVFDRSHFGPQLVECGRDLVLLLFMQREEKGDVVRIDAYNLDLEKRMWLKRKRLTDYAVFVDCGGKSAVACYKPRRWRAWGNTVYLAGTGCNTWIELPVGSDDCSGSNGDDDDVIPKYPGWDSPVSAKYMAAAAAAVFPSPMWVYPSMFF